MKRNIIDDHVLFGIDYWLSLNLQTRDHRNDYLRMKKMNYTSYITLIMPFPSSPNNLYLNENFIVSEAATRHNCYIPVFAYNPFKKDNDVQVRRLLKKHKLAGIIIWPILCQIDLEKLIDDVAFRSLLKEKEEEVNFFVCIHTGAGNEQDVGRVEKIGHYLPKDVVNVAESFPRIKFILTHLLRFSLPSIVRAANLSNIIIDTGGLSCQKRWFENGRNIFPAYDSGVMEDMSSSEALKFLVDNIKIENQLSFGSSFPFSMWWNFDIEDEIKLIETCEISNEAKEKIFYKNICKFLPELAEHMRRLNER
jgi:predicted TIM-barrel fold metal-dependent hydrolase